MKKILLLVLGMHVVFASSGEEAIGSKENQGNVLTVDPAPVYRVHDVETQSVMNISVFDRPATANNVLACIKMCKGVSPDILMQLFHEGNKVLGDTVLSQNIVYVLQIGTPLGFAFLRK